ncbi:hypothetical protein [Magnetococcus marinus]|uniref:hypothetical protein n=1 Tax=Magnetococcus marinus TaxID=1124597 RepID=UPI000038101F|nr:hypothetical protein [Magnetococcus marinus]
MKKLALLFLLFSPVCHAETLSDVYHQALRSGLTLQLDDTRIRRAQEQQKQAFS